MTFKATRAAYGEALVELAQKYPELIVLEADLSSATMTKSFAAKYPERFFDCGIAEANMTGIAAGMAACGLKPFTNTFAVFAAGRAYEQVRNSIAYPGLPVVVVGSHGGVSVGEDGATHQMVEDLALMRALPGMTVVNPCDANEMKCAVEALIRYDRPAYLRLGRAPVETVTDSLEGYTFEIGKGNIMRKGTDLTIISTGLCTQLSLTAAKTLEKTGISAEVINIHTIKPLDEELIIESAKKTGCVLCVEEHNILGGLGSAVSEVLSEKYPVKVVRHGIPDEFGRSGTAADVLDYFSLSANGITERALQMLGRTIEDQEETPVYYLSIDVESTGGRHTVGWMENSQLHTREVYRFPNAQKKENGHLVWDLEYMTEQVKKGIEEAKAEFGKIKSLAIDTWGVDYVLMNNDHEILPAYSYRDERTETSIPLVHQIVPFSQLYEKTGTQFLRFNTVYQLYDDLMRGRLLNATDFLMIPEYLMYRLCGVKVHEYTNASTTGLVNCMSGEYDQDLIRKLGLPPHLFSQLKKPGEVIGEYEGIKCVLCATHDTASAVHGIADQNNQPYICSGVWSLLGIRTEKPVNDPVSRLTNWSNEGGIDCICYQKNIIGMWLINELRRELCPDLPLSETAEEARLSHFEETADVNQAIFLSPSSMKEAFDSVLSMKPQSRGDYFRCAYHSLALCYTHAIQDLERNTGMTYDSIHIVGEGANILYLNELCEQVSGKKVIALPDNMSALGSLKIQMKQEV